MSADRIEITTNAAGDTVWRFAAPPAPLAYLHFLPDGCGFIRDEEQRHADRVARVEAAVVALREARAAVSAGLDAVDARVAALWTPEEIARAREDAAR